MAEPMFNFKWNIDTGAIGVRLRRAVARKAEETAQRLYDKVVEYTPVYTGSLRASWNLSQGKPNFAIVDGGTPKNPLSAPRQIAIATTDRPIFFVSNGQPYALIVEHGNERQAPAGMMRRAMADIR